MNVMTDAAPLSGFTNQATDSNRVFRAALEAMSRPGKIVQAPEFATPKGLNSAATSVLLALADVDTPIWIHPTISNDEILSHLRFHTGAEITKDISKAAFAIASAGSEADYLNHLSLGTPEMPHMSATLILLVNEFTEAPSMTLSGPGIKDKETLGVTPLPEGFLEWAQANQRLFPCGVDTFFASASSLAALPRSSKIEVK